ncbi:MAG: hypothetical protein V1883_04820 [Candidatus Omnitrophota bacterium]
MIVYAIAYLPSSYSALKELAIKEDWTVVSPEWADVVVAALTNSHKNPLKRTYENYKELEDDTYKCGERDAKYQVIYFYKPDKNGVLTLYKYKYYIDE